MPCATSRCPVRLSLAPAISQGAASAADYVAAAESEPALYGRANVFVYTNTSAAAVPHASFTQAAVAALLPGHSAFELSNTGRAHDGALAPLERHLPQRLQTQSHAGGGYSMRRMKRSALPQQFHAKLEDADDPWITSSTSEDTGRSLALRDEALSYLQEGQRLRAAEASLRVFRVVYKDRPRMPARARAATRSSSMRCETTGGCACRVRGVLDVHQGHARDVDAHERGRRGRAAGVGGARQQRRGDRR